MTEITFKPYHCPEPYRSRLLKHALYLRGELGPLKAAFDMNTYDQWGYWGYEDSRISHHTCGTVGCSLGHAPYSIGIDKNSGEGWEHYSGRVFGIHINSSCDAWNAWNWLFCGGWRSVDNTPEGAAVRIYILLNHGIPSNWDQQINGHAPLCYRKDIIITSSQEDLEKGRHLLAIA